MHLQRQSKSMVPQKAPHLHLLPKLPFDPSPNQPSLQPAHKYLITI